MSQPEAKPEASGLREIEATPALSTYLRDTWNRIPFAAYMAWYQVFSENSRLRMGLGWVIMRPILNAGIYGLIFGLLLGTNGRPENFIAFLIIGIFFYEFFANSLRQGANAITSNESLIKTISFPRLALPVSEIIRQLINMGFVMAVMVVMLLLLRVPIQLSWLWIIPIMVLYTMLCLGAASIVARATVHFRDLNSFLPFIIRLGLYASSVIFPLDRLLRQYPEAMSVMEMNPIHAILALARGALLPEYGMFGKDWVTLGIWAVILLPLGIIYFWRGESAYGRSN